ncbi:hypothetical protein ACP4OV_016815 [Aristida adscensionis]
MHAAMSSAPATTKSDAGIIADDMHPFLRRYKDGRVERLAVSAFVPPSEAPGPAGVATRDVVVDRATGVAARLFLSVGAAATGRRLPLVVYFHGGAFCTGSAFSELYHRYAAALSARAGALVVSVEYRLAPEHPVPAAYDDAWAALRWVASLADPWLTCHADPERVFLAGESAGANIVHNVAARSASSAAAGGFDIEGIVLLQPFFWGPERLPSERDRHDGPVFSPEFVDTLWPFLTAGAAGNDDPRINPPAGEVMSLPCRRALVAVAAKDVARDRGCRYAAWLRHGERRREVTLVESEGEDHGFHLYRPARASAVALMDLVAKFIDGGAAQPLPITAAAESGLHRHGCPEVHLRVPEDTSKICRSCRAGNNAFVAGQKAPATSFRRELGRTNSTEQARKGPFAPPAGLVAKSCL